MTHCLGAPRPGVGVGFHVRRRRRSGRMWRGCRRIDLQTTCVDHQHDKLNSPSGVSARNFALAAHLASHCFKVAHRAGWKDGQGVTIPLAKSNNSEAVQYCWPWIAPAVS
jgi:hypothetical protein